MATCTALWAPTAAADITRVLDVGDSWAFFPFSLQDPPALEAVLAEPEFGLDGILEDGSIGLTNIFAYGWDTPEQFQKITDRLNALPTLDICHVSIGGNDFVHGWKQQMTPEQVDELLDTIVGHIRNVIQYCLDQRPDVRVALVGYDYINLYDGFDINAFNQVYDYESVTHWAVTYWGYPVPETKQQVLDIVKRVHEVWVELERRKMMMAQEFPGRVSYVHNFGYVQHVYGIASAGVAPGVVGIPDGPENGYANFPNGRPDLYNPRDYMKKDPAPDGGPDEMDPLHLSPEGYLAFYENIVRQLYQYWLSDSTPPQVTDIRPLPGEENPTDNPSVVFEVRFSEPVTGVDETDFSLRTSDSLTGATIESVTGSGTTYHVTVNGYSGSGTVALDLIDNDSIYDAVWYPLRRLSDGSFKTGKPFWIDNGAFGCAFAGTLDTQGAAFYSGTLTADWTTADLDVDGLPDRYSVALLARLLCEAGHPQHAAAQAAFDANRTALNSEPGFAGFSANADAIAALCTVSDALKNAVSTALGLSGTYLPWKSDDVAQLGAAGDPDDDSRSNLLEYAWADDLGAGPVEFALVASIAGLGPPPGPACPDQDIYETQGIAFYEALDPQIDWTLTDFGDNGIPDQYEIALLAQVLCDGQHPLHDALEIVYENNVDELVGTPYEPYKDFLALFAATSQAIADDLVTALTIPAVLEGLEIAGDAPFEPSSDLDGDGSSNLEEYVWTFIRGGSPKVYGEEAADGTQAPNAALPNCDYALTFESQGADFYAFAFDVTSAWQEADVDQSTIPDRYEISVLAAILCDDTFTGHQQVLDAYNTNLAHLHAETGIPFLAPALDIMAALATYSQPLADLLKGAFNLTGTYTAYKVGNAQPLSALGDIDGDNRKNYQEFTDVGGLNATVPEYVRAAMGALYPPAPVLTVNVLDTNDPQPSVRGAVYYALKVEWSLDGTNWFPASVDNNEWSFVPPDALADGVYDVRVRATGAFNRDGADETTDELTVDTVAPVITMNGDSRLVTEAGEPYVDPGATALDDREGNLTAELSIVNGVDTDLVDTFTVLYNVRDSAGNAAIPAQRIVDVRDRIKPVLTLNGDAEIDLDAGQPFVDPGATAIDSYNGDISGDVVVTGTVDENTPGDYELQYDVHDGTGNDADPVTRTVHVADATPPIVTLLGDSPYHVEAGTPYVEPGATAEDAFEGDVTASIQITGLVDSGVPGPYERVYTAEDAAGNVSEPVVRPVVVSDTIPPTVTLNGDNPMTVEAGTTFTEPGATANDSFDGDLSNLIGILGGVNTSIPGAYQRTYAVRDAAGNFATAVVRTVNVVDTVAPEITLVGDNPLNHEAATIYADPGVTATDAIYGDLTSSVVIELDVNPFVPGNYIVNYSVTDGSGNSAQVSRTVHVVDTTLPVITLVGEANIDHEAGTPYNDAGATAFDTLDGNLTGAIDVHFDDGGGSGTYTVTFNVADAAGNHAVPVVRTVHVIDTHAPVITLVGDAEISISCRDEFSDPGATATDSADGDISAQIQVQTAVDPQDSAKFTLTYTVSDSAGNPASPKVRTVTVLDDCANSVDTDGDFRIVLAELLRVIQFYNSLGLHCADVPEDTEDGYVPGAGANESCTPYDADYAPQNWIISLNELLRLIQFYNSGGYYPCPDDGTEDGFCAGPAPG